MECCAAAAEVSLMMAHYRPNKLAADISLALFRLLTLLPAGLAQLLTYEVMDFLTNCPTESRGQPRVQIALYNKNWTRPLKKKKPGQEAGWLHFRSPCAARYNTRRGSAAGARGQTQVVTHALRAVELLMTRLACPPSRLHLRGPVPRARTLPLALNEPNRLEWTVETRRRRATPPPYTETTQPGAGC